MSGLTCENARNLFDAYLNGELPTAMETELNAHRLRCPRCRHELALLEVTGEVIAADDGAPALSNEFSSRLLACVTGQYNSPQHRRRRLIRIGAQVLAAAACIALAVIHFSGPEKKVAGFKTPRINVSPSQVGAADRFADAEQPASPQETFQAQLERALTEWRNDASSLKKMYQFFTPQIHEEMRLEDSENGHDQPDQFEPGQPDAPPESTTVSGQIVEDI